MNSDHGRVLLLRQGEPLLPGAEPPRAIAHSLSLDKARSCAVAVVRATVMRDSRAFPRGSDYAVDRSDGHQCMIIRKSACSIRPYKAMPLTL